MAREGKTPTALWKEFGAAGLLGLAIEERYGGGGGALGDLAVVTEELAAAGIPLMLLALSPAPASSRKSPIGARVRVLRGRGGVFCAGREVGEAVALSLEELDPHVTAPDEAVGAGGLVVALADVVC